MNEKEQRPGEAATYDRGDISLKGQGKGSDYIVRNQFFDDSFESEKLQSLIEGKKKYLQSITNPNHGRKLQEEIMFLQNDIMPIILHNTALTYHEVTKWITGKIHEAVNKQCDTIVVVLPLTDRSEDPIRVATINPHRNNPIQGLNIEITGNGERVRVEEVQI